MSSNLVNIGNLSKWMLSSILLFLEIPSSVPSSVPIYEWQDHQTNEKLVCQQCPPGTSVAQHCTKDTPTLCKPCPSLYYTQYWNYLEDCLYCNVFCDNLEVEVQQCNGTHNRACQCKPGYYADSDFCLPHSKCPLGTGVARHGNQHMDTQCAPCAPGTFSINSSQPCQPHRNCSKEGLMVNVPGNRFHDTLCTSCNISRANIIEELVGKTDSACFQTYNPSSPLPWQKRSSSGSAPLSYYNSYWSSTGSSWSPTSNPACHGKRVPVLTSPRHACFLYGENFYLERNMLAYEPPPQWWNPSYQLSSNWTLECNLFK